MIKQCTCGGYPEIRESGIGWQAVCTDCYKFVAGWARLLLLGII